MSIDQAVIDEIVRRILSVTKPERIILYGSAATGTMTPDSDVDLLVIEDLPSRQWRVGTTIQNALEGIGYRFDVKVMPLVHFEESKDVIGGLAFPANKYGKVIYPAA